MKTGIHTGIGRLALTLLLIGQFRLVSGQEDGVRAELSSRKAWVGSPVVLQIRVENATDVQPPELPQTDGLQIQPAGPPSTSTQIRIFNGRRTESSSITLQYRVVPLREGNFTIPPLTLHADGRRVQTQPLALVATESETGDLLFVGITGKQKRVYVGQPLDLVLRIWIKPFRDRERNLTLSESDMWQMISEQSDWGSFLDVLRGMAQNRQRPAGEEVLRDDGQGNQRSYWLYEVETTVYPKQAGTIGADEVRIVVNYPLSLGRARDPLEDFFGDSPFGGSIFGNRLGVTASRPVQASASVDAIEVVPVPTAGRPPDYQGAVGRYRIVADASPKTVAAGDPIQLQIGILGTGPMELVQAPPLAALPELTRDFHVSDRPLAGVVEGNRKVFSTTIRPRRAGIREIPPLRFSFFDPQTERFETVTSQPIPLTVNTSESLAFDSIVSSGPPAGGNGEAAEAPAATRTGPDFSNRHDPSLLVSKSEVPSQQFWIWILIVPPAILGLAVLGRGAAVLAGCFSRFGSVARRGKGWIRNASSGKELAEGLVRYVSRKMRLAETGNRPAALGALRVAGLYETAAGLEEFLDCCDRLRPGDDPLHLEDLRARATGWLAEIEQKMRRNRRSFVTAPRQGRSLRDAAIRKRGRVPAPPSAGAVWILGLAIAAGPNGSGGALAAPQTGPSFSPTLELNADQQRTLLDEAAGLYERASKNPDPEAMRNGMLAAAGKYRLLVESGIQNAGIHGNLGNALLQAGQRGRAIASYRRALRLDPGNRQWNANLDFAVGGTGMVGRQGSDGERVPTPAAGRRFPVLDSAARFNRILISAVGFRPMVWLAAIASFLFWGLWTLRVAGCRGVRLVWSILPGLALLVATASLWLSETIGIPPQVGILVADEVPLRIADGEESGNVTVLENAEGGQVEVLDGRRDWVRIRTGGANEGWVRTAEVEILQ